MIRSAGRWVSHQRGPQIAATVVLPTWGGVVMMIRSMPRARTWANASAIAWRCGRATIVGSRLVARSSGSRASPSGRPMRAHASATRAAAWSIGTPYLDARVTISSFRSSPGDRIVFCLLVVGSAAAAGEPRDEVFYLPVEFASDLGFHLDGGV